jgi:hypothetical protein
MAPSIESQMFEVVTSMVTSCPVILDEPPIMAVVRIMTGAERLIGALEDHSLADDFLTEARSEWLRIHTTMMSDPQSFAIWLDQFSARFVLEAKRRNLEQLESGSATT